MVGGYRGLIGLGVSYVHPLNEGEKWTYFGW